jgi:hypothetical protein
VARPGRPAASPSRSASTRRRRPAQLRRAAEAARAAETEAASPAEEAEAVMPDEEMGAGAATDGDDVETDLAAGLEPGDNPDDEER